jgi:tetratricopeptide (TPR) repeat protein
MKKLVLFLFLSFATLPYVVHAQEAVEEVFVADEDQADDLFFNENYKEALKHYLELLREDPENLKFNFNTGLCYLNSDFEKIKSIPYFEKVIFYDEEASTVYYLMGQAYQSDFQFDRAIDMFNNFIQFYTMGADFSVEDAEHQIEYCENAYELMKFPKEVKWENLGPKINSPYPDYFPFVTTDESFIAYTSKRDDGSKKLPDGTYASNIYYSRVVEGEFSEGIPMPGADNDPAESEVVIGMSGDGDKMLLMKGLESISGDIYEADFENNRLQNIQPLDKQVNSKFREIAATLSPDGNTIYFVSDRPGGYGGTDVWIIKKLPTGAWGVPFNAGPDVNTDRDEDFPNVSPDGDYLFFSSKGHFSMGGFDIFKAKWNADSNRYMNPRNLGYPINSVDDDMNYRLSRTGRYGYMSALREDGYGDYDIYRITIKEVESEYSVLRGVITSSDQGMEVDGADITVTNLMDGELFGVYTPNPNSMRYVIILPPGEFEVYVDSPGFEPVSFEVKILGKSSFQPEIDKDLQLVAQ